MGERGALCILLMICIIGGAFLLGGLLFSRSVSTILKLVVAMSPWTSMRTILSPRKKWTVLNHETAKHRNTETPPFLFFLIFLRNTETSLFWDLGIGICYLVFAIWYLVFGIWYLVFGIWNLGFGIWDLGFSIWDFLFGIWYLVFGVWYLLFGIWYLVFGIC